MNQKIKVKNSRVHNLKEVSVEIPKNKLTVITGLSGSGKSSLAFDTIYAEGQRRYAESMSAQARKFMDIEDKPDVDDIEGLSPTIAISQQNNNQNPRSTVGTATEIYDLLRLLFARAGTQYDPETGEKAESYSKGEVTELVRQMKKDKDNDLVLLSPIVKEEEIDPDRLISRIEPVGCSDLRVNGEFMTIHELQDYDFKEDKKYSIELVIETLEQDKKQNIQMLTDKALDLSDGFVKIYDKENNSEVIYSTVPYAKKSQKEFPSLETRSFSFNSPYGACPRCNGLGYTMEVDPDLAVPNEDLSLDEGAIQPWARLTGNKKQKKKLLEKVADEHGFSMKTKVKKLSDKVMNILLYGDDKEYEINGKTKTFSGVVPDLTQRHNETDSDYVKEKVENYMKERVCSVCEGKRLKPSSLSVRIGDYSIADITEKTIEEAKNIFEQLAADEENDLNQNIDEGDLNIAKPIAKEIKQRLEDLMQVGLYYLTLDRSLNTLAGGEAQRIRLSTQISTGLTDIIYVLDEPTIGLHAKDNQKLIDTLNTLKEKNNTVIVVEHDEQTIEAADHVIDLGPRAGKHGGKVIAEGSPEEIKQVEKSVTAGYLTGREKIEVPEERRTEGDSSLEIKGAKAFNLKNIDVELPLERFICVTGVSGSGKSTLVTNIISKALHQEFHQAKSEPAEHEEIKGTGYLNKVITIDQDPIGRTPRSNPATYTGLFTPIREIFADTPEAKMKGMDPGYFSFNVKGAGRCEACSGNGYKEISMQFMSDVYIKCPECQGKRYNQETLEVHYRQKNIADVLDMTIHEAYRFFNDHKSVASKLKVLRDVGLGYLRLGQPATTLSGGEAQRIKLAKELSKRDTGDTLYILDEPTTGLHFEDIKKLLMVLNELVEKGNTVLTIEHNLNVIKCADWLIDMGPEGGKKGGEVVAEGTPEQVANTDGSFTGKYLKEALNQDN
ncbi:MAG: excinuclease ABC subunit UvrA [Candidatus Paceibacteria bacterium]